jgi:hypothetical protein
MFPNLAFGGKRRVRDLILFAWKRLGIISSIVGDTVARVISVLFYCTILVPFGLGSRLFSDPLRLHQPQAVWLAREPLSHELEAAKQQG